MTLFVVMNGAERWKNVKGKQSFQFALAYSVYSDCVFFLFIVYPYLLICIVPLMSVKFPVKLTEDKSFYLSAKICMRKKRRKKQSSVANLLFKDLHQN